MPIPQCRTDSPIRPKECALANKSAMDGFEKKPRARSTRGRGRRDFSQKTTSVPNVHAADPFAGSALPAVPRRPFGGDPFRSPSNWPSTSASNKSPFSPPQAFPGTGANTNSSAGRGFGPDPFQARDASSPAPSAFVKSSFGVGRSTNFGATVNSRNSHAPFSSNQSVVNDPFNVVQTRQSKHTEPLKSAFSALRPSASPFGDTKPRPDAQSLPQSNSAGNAFSKSPPNQPQAFGQTRGFSTHPASNRSSTFKPKPPAPGSGRDVSKSKPGTRVLVRFIREDMWAEEALLRYFGGLIPGEVLHVSLSRRQRQNQKPDSNGPGSRSDLKKRSAMLTVGSQNAANVLVSMSKNNAVMGMRISLYRDPHERDSQGGEANEAEGQVGFGNTYPDVAVGGNEGSSDPFKSLSVAPPATGSNADDMVPESTGFASELDPSTTGIAEWVNPSLQSASQSLPVHQDSLQSEQQSPTTDLHKKEEMEELRERIRKLEERKRRFTAMKELKSSSVSANPKQAQGRATSSQPKNSQHEQVPSSAASRSSRKGPANSSKQSQSKRTDDWRAGPSKMELKYATAFVGTCQEMCPKEEQEQRIRERDISPFEMAPGRDGKATADRSIMVKKFMRAAAATQVQVAEKVRPPGVLNDTMDYLITKIMTVDSMPYYEVYHFVSDRTRCIRQDLTLQGAKEDDGHLAVLEKATRFHILSQELCTGMDREMFDRKMNFEQLKNCLISLMATYKHRRDHGLSSPNEPEFQAYNILCFSQSQEVSRVCADLDQDTLHSRPVQFALLALSCISEPLCLYSTFFDMVRAAPYLVACLLHGHFSRVRTRALDIMRCSRPPRKQPRAAHGQGSSSSLGDFSLIELQEILGFDNEEQVSMFCTWRGDTVQNGQVLLERSIDPPSEPWSDSAPSDLIQGKISDASLPDVLFGLHSNSHSFGMDTLSRPLKDRLSKRIGDASQGSFTPRVPKAKSASAAGQSQARNRVLPPSLRVYRKPVIAPDRLVKTSPRKADANPSPSRNNVPVDGLVALKQSSSNPEPRMPDPAWGGSSTLMARNTTNVGLAIRPLAQDRESSRLPSNNETPVPFPPVHANLAHSTLAQPQPVEETKGFRFSNLGSAEPLQKESPEEQDTTPEQPRPPITGSPEKPIQKVGTDEFAPDRTVETHQPVQEKIEVQMQPDSEVHAVSPKKALNPETVAAFRVSMNLLALDRKLKEFENTWETSTFEREAKIAQFEEMASSPNSSFAEADKFGKDLFIEMYDNALSTLVPVREELMSECDTEETPLLHLRSQALDNLDRLVRVVQNDLDRVKGTAQSLILRRYRDEHTHPLPVSRVTPKSEPEPLPELVKLCHSSARGKPEVSRRASNLSADPLACLRPSGDVQTFAKATNVETIVPDIVRIMEQQHYGMLKGVVLGVEGAGREASTWTVNALSNPNSAGLLSLVKAPKDLPNSGSKHQQLQPPFLSLGKAALGEFSFDDVGVVVCPVDLKLSATAPSGTYPVPGKGVASKVLAALTSARSASRSPIGPPYLIFAVAGPVEPSNQHADALVRHFGLDQRSDLILDVGVVYVAGPTSQTSSMARSIPHGSSPREKAGPAMVKAFEDAVRRLRNCPSRNPPKTGPQLLIDEASRRSTAAIRIAAAHLMDDANPYLRTIELVNSAWERLANDMDEEASRWPVEFGPYAGELRRVSKHVRDTLRLPLSYMSDPDISPQNAMLYARSMLSAVEGTAPQDFRWADGDRPRLGQFCSIIAAGLRPYIALQLNKFSNVSIDVRREVDRSPVYIIRGVSYATSAREPPSSAPGFQCSYPHSDALAHGGTPAVDEDVTTGFGKQRPARFSNERGAVVDQESSSWPVTEGAVRGRNASPSLNTGERTARVRHIAQTGKRGRIAIIDDAIDMRSADGESRLRKRPRSLSASGPNVSRALVFSTGTNGESGTATRGHDPGASAPSLPTRGSGLTDTLHGERPGIPDSAARERSVTGVAPPKPTSAFTGLQGLGSSGPSLRTRIESTVLQALEMLNSSHDMISREKARLSALDWSNDPLAEEANNYIAAEKAMLDKLESQLRFAYLTAPRAFSVSEQKPAMAVVMNIQAQQKRLETYVGDQILRYEHSMIALKKQSV